MKQVSPSISLDLGVLMTHMIASFIPTLWGTKTYWIIETCHWASLLSLVCVCFTVHRKDNGSNEVRADGLTVTGHT